MRKQYANKKRCVARLILFCLFFQHVSLVHASASMYATASELVESEHNYKKDIAPLLERIAKKNEHMSVQAQQAIAQLQKNNKKYPLHALITIMPELLGELYVLEKEVEVALIEKNAEKAVASTDVLCGSIEGLGAFKQEIQEQLPQVADVVEKVTQEVSTLLERTLNEAGEQMCICPILKVTRSCCVPTLCLQCCATLNSLLNVVIQDIANVDADLLACCSTLNSKIDNLSTVTAVVDLTGVYTSINAVESSVESCCSQLSSQIANISTVTAVVDLTGVYTSLNSIESSIQSCCSQLSSQIEHLTVTAAVDLTGVYTSLNQIESSINSLVTTVTADFNGTFTMLNAIESNLQSCCTTLNSEINALVITVTTDFAGTFTMLNLIESSINSLVTTVTSDFAGTFTALAKIDADLLACCSTLNSEISSLVVTVTTDFAGTFTMLNQIESSINNLVTTVTADFNGTFTMLNLIESSINSLATTVTTDFAGTFTALAKIDADLLACCSTLNSEISSLAATVTTDFNGTFTMLNAIESNLQSCCTTLNSEINALVITVTTDLAGTFTVLNQIESSINSLATTVTTDFAGTFTALAKIDADLLACCSTLNSEISSLAATVTTDFYATFTTLNQIQSSINNISTGSCTVDFFGTYTMLNLIESSINSLTTTVTTDFAGTFTVLAKIDADLLACCSTLNSEISSLAATVTTDFYATFTTLNQIQSSINNISTGSCTVDFFGTYTMLNLIESSINSLTTTVTTDFAGTFTALAKIDADLLACCSTLNSELNALTITVTTDFAGTFTMLNLIESSINSLSTTVTTDFAGTFTALAKIDADLLACCSTLNSELNALTITVTTDFAGTFTMLNLIESSINSLATTVTTDFAGTFTVLAKIDADLLNCCSTLSSELNALIVTVTTDFNGTFTMLNLIESSVNSLATTVTTDFAYTWSLLNNLSTCSVISFSGGNITSPGNYCLANNLTSGVTISANNVMLNLNGHSINTTGNGITANSVSELVIRNGIIQNTSGANSGIAVTGVNNLLIEDLQFNNNSMAITCSGCAGFVIEKTQVLSGANSASNPAISMISSNNGVLRTTEVTAPTTPFAQAVLVQDSEGIIIQNCASLNNTAGFIYATSTSANTVAAVTEYCTATGGTLAFGNSSNSAGIEKLVFNNCVAQQKTSSTSTGWQVQSNNTQSSIACVDCVTENAQIGFSVQTFNFTADRCTANNSSSVGISLATQPRTNSVDSIYTLRNCSSTTSQNMAGFQIQDTTNATQTPAINIIDCSAQGSVTGFLASAGTTPVCVNLKGCIAQQGNISNSAIGFSFTGPVVVKLTDCDSNYNSGGGYLVNASCTATFNNCRALDNEGIGFSLLGNNATLINCLATQNSSDGFTVGSGVTNSSIIDCQATQNLGNGFNLSSAGTGCTVGQCTATNNDQMGFVGNGNATTLVSNVRFYQNVANSNTFGNFDQYSLPLQQIIPNPIPVFDGSVITSSGSYALAQNLAVSIIIEANDVVFDLNGHTLDGYITAASVSNLVIKNGIIENPTGRTGISATSVNNLLIQDVQFNSNSTAINFQNCSNFVIERVHVMSGANAANIQAIVLANSNSGTLRSIEVQSLLSQFQVALAINGGLGLEIKDFLSQNNQSGFFLSSGSSAISAVVENCTVEGSTGAAFTNNNASGSMQLVFNNCIAQQVGIGWLFQNTNLTASIICSDCIVDGISSSAITNLGAFNIQCYNFSAYRCFVNQLNNISAGFTLTNQANGTNDSNYLLKECLVSTSSLSSGYVVNGSGTGLDLNPTIDILDCSAQGCNIGYTELINVTNAFHPNFVRCTAQGCISDGFSVGSNVVLTNCISNNNGGNGYNANNSGFTASFNGCSAQGNTLNGFSVPSASNSYIFNRCNSIGNKQNGYSFLSTGTISAFDCNATNNTQSGFNIVGSGVSTAMLSGCNSNGNTGAGYTINNSSSKAMAFKNCSAYSNSPGFVVSGSGPNSIIGCLSSQNSGNGFDLSASTQATVGANVVGQCTATSNTGTGFVGNGNSSTLVSTVRFYQNMASGNGTNFDQYSLPLQQIIPNPIPVYGDTVITSSGSYALAQNLATGLTISANDVVLDLNGHTIATTGNGILISSGQQNIKIKNGRITNSVNPSVGISGAGNNQNIIIEGVDFFNCYNAINIASGSTDIYIKNVNSSEGGGVINVTAGTCEITGCAVSDAFQGGFLITSTSCSMRNCTTLNVTGVANFSITSDEAVLDTCFVNGGSVVGYLLARSANTKGATLMNCVSQGVSSGNGYSLIYPQNFNFINCSAINSASDGFGYSSGTAGTGQSVVFNGCTALNNNGNGFNYVTLNTSANFVFRNCQANKNGSIGFALTGMTNATLSDCQVINNGGDGIALNTVTNSVLTRCYSFNNAGIDGGIYLNNCQNSSILQCVSHQNADNGIEINNVTNCAIDNCFTTSNPGSGIEISGTNGSQKLAIKNSASSGNANHGFDIGGGSTNSNYSLDACSALSNGATGFNAARSNGAFNNCIAVGNTNVGFQYSASDQTFKECVSENNGVGFYMSSVSPNVLISGCKAVKNGTQGFDVTQAGSNKTVVIELSTAAANGGTGFYGSGTTLGTNAVFYLNNAMGNTTAPYTSIAGAAQTLLSSATINYGANLED